MKRMKGVGPRNALERGDIRSEARLQQNDRFSDAANVPGNCSTMREPTTATHRYLHAHEAVTANEYWYGDGPPLLKATFSAAKTADRQTEVLELLEKAADKSKTADHQQQQSRQLRKLENKLDRCRRHDRCGSQACPECARAFQRAKAAAQQELIKQITKCKRAPYSSTKSTKSESKSERILVMATVIPLRLRYTPADLPSLDIAKANRWLKDTLTKAGLTQMMVGSADIGWEYRQGKHYYQLHWHLATWTNNPERLQKQLARCFPPKNKYGRPVQISKSFNLDFLPYLNKAIKLPDLLRRNRSDLSQLLLALDRTAPLDLMVICGLRLSAQSGRLALRPLRHEEA
jgi:hypothetical protein